MTKAIIQALATLLLLSISGSFLYRIFTTVVFGSYAQSATIPMTVFVAVIIPALIILATIRLLIAIWKTQ